jgi:hypothetical protein
MEPSLGILHTDTIPNGLDDMHHAIKLEDFYIKEENESLEQVIADNTKSIDEAYITAPFEFGILYPNDQSYGPNELHHVIKLEEFDIKEEKGILEQLHVGAESADKTNITAAATQVETEANERESIMKGVSMALKLEGFPKDGKRNEMMLNEIHREIKLEDFYISADDESNKMIRRSNAI